MTTTTATSVRIRSSIALLENELSWVGGRIWRHPDLRNIYPEYLIALHMMIRTSVPLMEAAHRECLPLAERGDEVARHLARYLDRHIDEERGHDDWLLEDLELIGVPRATVLARVPRYDIACLTGAQYYYVFHHHPIALLGYIATIEGYPPLEELAHVAADATGYPLTAFRTIRKHANLDVFHRRELDEMIDELPLDEAQVELVNTAAIRTMGAVIHMLASMID